MAHFSPSGFPKSCSWSLLKSDRDLPEGQGAWAGSREAKRHLWLLPPAGVQTSPAFLPEHTRMGPAGPTTPQYIAITVVVSCLGLKACFYLSSFSIPG